MHQHFHHVAHLPLKHEGERLVLMQTMNHGRVRYEIILKSQELIFHIGMRCFGIGEDQPRLHVIGDKEIVADGDMAFWNGVCHVLSDQGNAFARLLF